MICAVLEGALHMAASHHDEPDSLKGRGKIHLVHTASRHTAFENVKNPPDILTENYGKLLQQFRHKMNGGFLFR